MMVNILKVVLILFFFTTFSAKAEKIVIVDINALITNSKAGQSIKIKLKEEKDLLTKQFKSKEDDLKSQEKKLISKKMFYLKKNLKIKKNL